MWGILEEVTVEKAHCGQGRAGGRKHEGEGLGGAKARPQGPQHPIPRVDLPQEPWEATI